jgi:hypothetical protein
MRTRGSLPIPIRRSAFAGFCFPPEVIVLAVRWYLRFGLSYRDVEELLSERGVEITLQSPTTARTRDHPPSLPTGAQAHRVALAWQRRPTLDSLPPVATGGLQSAGT